MGNRLEIEHKPQLSDHVSRALAANAMSESLKLFAKRSYLSDINKLELDAHCPNPVGTIHWVKICQVGKSITSSVRKYFSTIQKILYSCHDPGNKQVVFLIKGDGKQISLYIGLRNLNDDGYGEDEAIYLSNNIKNIWAGTQTEFIEDTQRMGPDKCFADPDLRKIYSITGIPSFTKNEGEESLTAIDALIGALAYHKFAYVVFADPVKEEFISGIIDQCNELAGQLETVKSYSFQEGENSSTGITEGESETESDTETKRAKAKLLIMGLTLAAGIGFLPAIGEVASPLLSGLISLANSKNYGLGVMTLGTIFGGGIPQKSHSTSKTKSTTRSWTTGQSQTISQTFVNRHVSYSLGLLDSQLARFEQGQGEGMWRTTTFLLTGDDVVGRNAVMQLKSIVSGQNSHLEPIRTHRIDRIKPVIKGCNYNIPDITIKIKQPNDDTTSEGCVLPNPFEGGSSTLSTLLTTEELSMFINFPQKSVPGLSVIEGTEALKLTPPAVNGDKRSIPVGKLLYSNAETSLDISIPISTLAKHTLVAGVNGSGKTNTILGILNGLSKNNCPFLVLEPAKTEYVEWALKYNEELAEAQKENRRRDETAIRIIMPGKNRYMLNGKEYPIVDKLAFNPFEVIALKDEGPGESDVLAHIDRVKSVFASAFPMDEILPVVMEMLIYHIYTERKWLSRIGEVPSDEHIENREFPNLSYMAAHIYGVIDGLGYEERIKRNISAALTTRVKSLLRGWKYEMLNTKCSKDGFWQDLFNGKCIINLSGVGDDTDRSFIMSLLLMFMYEYRIAESESKTSFSFSSNEMRHMMVVEEAHRVMGHCVDVKAPQYKCGIMFSNILSEIRAYGQGLMVVDQVPSRLIPDAIKNTNVKIIHRLIAIDDIEAMAGSLGLDDKQQKIIPRLSTGQAIVSGIGSGEIGDVADFDVYWCKISKYK